MCAYVSYMVQKTNLIMPFKSLFTVFLFFASKIISAQSKTANDYIPPYPSEVFFGTNMGYFPGWTDEDLATISKGDPNKNVEGILKYFNFC